MDTSPLHDPNAALEASEKALASALAALALPIARLAVARGLHFATLEDMLKLAFVRAATEALQEANPGVQPHRMVSRISATTGIHRREVGRLQSLEQAPAPSTRPSVATALFSRWITDPTYRTDDGLPLRLPRQGDAPSFEHLAHSVTRDVHPRTLLDELCRLEMAVWDEASDTVSLSQQAFVPKGDTSRMLGFLGANVGDHLQAAVSNVIASGTTPPHFEQAVFSDELSEQSLLAIKDLMRQQWQTLVTRMIPLMEKLIEEDRLAGRPQVNRVRVGLYSYSEPTPPQEGEVS